jgi:hypothetical protein
MFIVITVETRGTTDGCDETPRPTIGVAPLRLAGLAPADCMITEEPAGGTRPGFA